MHAAPVARTEAPYEAAGRRLAASDRSPLFVADWLDAVFLHYRIARHHLASLVPFPLDTYAGWAYVSLVAFTMRRMRPALGGRLAAALVSPIADHGFLNVRTYVRHAGEPGIYFLAEWLPNRLAVLLGPRTFGLPYRLGRLACSNDSRAGRLVGDVADASGRGRLSYQGAPDGSLVAPARTGSLDEFLLERYTCFTQHAGRRGRFRIGHGPWPQQSATVEVLCDGLLDQTGTWREHATFVGANCSSGVRNVQIGRPRRIL